MSINVLSRIDNTIRSTLRLAGDGVASDSSSDSGVNSPSDMRTFVLWKT